ATRVRLLHDHRKHPTAAIRALDADRRLRAPDRYHLPAPYIRLRRDLAARHGNPGTARARCARRHSTDIQGHRHPMNLDRVHRYLICYDVVRGLPPVRLTPDL